MEDQVGDFLKQLAAKLELVLFDYLNQGRTLNDILMRAAR